MRGHHALQQKTKEVAETHCEHLQQRDDTPELLEPRKG